MINSGNYSYVLESKCQERNTRICSNDLTDVQKTVFLGECVSATALLISDRFSEKHVKSRVREKGPKGLSGMKN